MLARRSCWVAAPLALVTVAIAVAAAGPAARPHLAIAIWRGAPNGQPLPAGGMTYGGMSPTGALVIEQRELDVPASGDVRMAGVAATIEPASAQLHAADATGLAISAERYLTGATTPTEILARHVGETVTVVTAKGELTGVLRAIDAQVLLLEVGGGLQVMRRDVFVQDIRLPTATATTPTLVWSVTATKPGVQTVELAYRAGGIAWTPDYTAILDDANHTIELAANAIVHNGTGATFDDAELTLIDATTAPARPGLRLVLPAHARLGANETVQVDLLATHPHAKAAEIVSFEAQPIEPASIPVTMEPELDCAQLIANTNATYRAEIDLEIPTGSPVVLPEGHARMFRRSAAPERRLEQISEDGMHTSPGLVRVRVGTAESISGVRKQLSCTADIDKRRLTEKIQLDVANHGAKAQDVIARELAWRSTNWHIDPTSESTKGSIGGTSVQEYRLHVPATGSTKITYTIVYAW